MRREPAWITVGLLIMGPFTAGAAPEAAPQGVGAKQSTATSRLDVRLKTLDSAAVVLVEHRGPYWRMGSLFAQVAEFMASHDQAGPMFARYLDDPAQVGVQDLRAEVGFFARGEQAVPAPYQRVVWPARRVASLTVPGHYGRAPAAYARVFEWIEANGHQAEGPITEVYLSEDGQAGSADRVTEIRVRLAGEAGHGAVVPHPDGPGSQVADRGSPEGDRVGRPAEPGGPAQREAPSQRAISPPMEQVLVRLEAIRRAFAASYPQQASLVDAYVGPILARPGWQAVRVAARPAVLVVPGAAEGEEEKALAAVVSRLDVLLVNVTLGETEPAAVLKELAELTDWVSGAVADVAPGERLRD